MDHMQHNTKPGPPPYIETEHTPQDFFDRVVNFAGQQQADVQNVAASSAPEAERIRGLLTFTLSMDYQCNNQAFLSAADRDHFTTMGNLLFRLKKASTQITVLASERHQLAIYFWKYLHEPCKILDIPPESVLLCISRMLRYVNSIKGTYEGSCFGILQDHGLDDLAAKMYVDQRILIPRLIYDLPTRHRMHRAVSELRERYFTRIYSIEGSTDSGFPNPRGWANLQTVVYDATERGKMFERLRKETSMAAHVHLSVRHWLDKVSRCVAAVKARAKAGQADKPNPPYRYPVGWTIFADEVSCPNFVEERRTRCGILL